MLRAISLLFALIAAANCDQLSVLYAPKAVEFSGNSRLDSEALPEVFGAALGYSVSLPTEWDGMIIKDPFNTANGAVVVVAEGLESVTVEVCAHDASVREWLMHHPPFFLQGAKSYQLDGNTGSVALSELIQKSADHQGVSFEVDLKESSDNFATPLGTVQPDDEEVKPQHLKPKSNKADSDFLRQIAFLNGLSDLLVTSTDRIPTVHIVRVSFEALVAAHEPNSPALEEAKKLFVNALAGLETASEKAFDGAVIVGLVTASEGQLVVRSKRQAVQPKQDDGDDNPMNLAAKYNSNYPVMFNIILWFSVVLVFSLIAISIVIGTMDPGRDSIIYRMTSTRMKKDN
ncbi:ATPase H(+)-transporting accessory protein 2 isoform X1 [Anopheles stephensi]|uniref:ATPase H(+)-transporting accessory protein 2 isoform X1 n=1 Tax=Anopheles stephensi TaxID=30069 RepID=UPI001658AF59|nr:ATPase H(+)-transporting accessory protein 2 isoform X1 [Anopheles stephensi]